MKRPLMLVLVLAACGEDRPGTLPDAPLAPDAPPAPLKLTVRAGGMPVADVAVVFQDSNSVVVAASKTDANGEATAAVEAGGFVTAIEPADPGAPERLTTFAGVKPLDDLRLDLPTRGGTLVTFNVTVPLDAGAVTYELHTSCGMQEVAPTATSVTLRGCDGMADLAVVTFGRSRVPRNALFKANVAVANGVALAVTGTYVAFGTTTAGIQNIPAAIASVILDHRIATARGTVFQTSGREAAPGGATWSFSRPLAVPVTTGTTSIMLSTLVPAQASVPIVHEILDWAPYGAAYTLDTSGMLLPDISVAPAFDPATRAIAWTDAPTSASPDLVLASYRTQRAAREWTWRIAAPHKTSIAYPKLPLIDTFDYNTLAADTFDTVDVTTAKVPGGYDAFRPNAFGTIDAVGASGRMSLVRLQR